jgi:hypothetical protein
MLARRMPSILPPMTHDESLDVTAIYSIAGLLGNDPHIVHRRPFRSPPSVRINGIDVEPAAQSVEQFGLMCRTYPTAHGSSEGAPPLEMIREALRKQSRRIAKVVNVTSRRASRSKRRISVPRTRRVAVLDFANLLDVNRCFVNPPTVR